MKLWSLILIFFLISCSSVNDLRAPSSDNKTKHIVFDLDGTLVYTVRARRKNQAHVYQVGDHYYKLAPGALETIRFLMRDESIAISFFSGGKKERNISLLSQIKIFDSISLLDIAHKTLHFEDLVDLGEQGPDAKFTDRYKKDLELVTDDLSQIILIDDQEDFVPARQKKNLFYLGSAYWYHDSYEDVLATKEREPRKKHLAPSRKHFVKERRKFEWIKATLSLALKNDSSSVSFLDSVTGILYDAHGQRIPRNSPLFDTLFEQGRAAIYGSYSDYCWRTLERINQM